MHAERAQQIRYQLDRSRYERLQFGAWQPAVGGETRLDDSSQEYGDPAAATVVTQNPAVKAALDALTARWPSTQSRQELLNEVQTQLRAAGADATNVEGSIDDLLDFLIVRGPARYRLDPVVVEPASTRCGWTSRSGRWRS